MKKPIIIALGLRDAKMIERIREITVEYLARHRSDMQIEFTSAPTAEESLRGIAPMLREACTRAQLLRAQTKAPVAVASADGIVEVLYRNRARRTQFKACLVVGCGPRGPICIAGPSGCPQEAQEEYQTSFQRTIAHLHNNDSDATEEDYAADVAVNVWMNALGEFPEPTIELLN